MIRVQKCLTRNYFYSVWRDFCEKMWNLQCQSLVSLSSNSNLSVSWQGKRKGCVSYPDKMWNTGHIVDFFQCFCKTHEIPEFTRKHYYSYILCLYRMPQWSCVIQAEERCSCIELHGLQAGEAKWNQYYDPELCKLPGTTALIFCAEESRCHFQCSILMNG